MSIDPVTGLYPHEEMKSSDQETIRLAIAELENFNTAEALNLLRPLVPPYDLTDERYGDPDADLSSA